MITGVIWFLLSLSTVKGSINLARGKLASQSSTSLDAVASRAVDGNTDTSIQGGSCSSTLNESITSWEVDLGRHYTVYRIKITSSSYDEVDNGARYEQVSSEVGCCRIADGSWLSEYECGNVGQEWWLVDNLGPVTQRRRSPVSKLYVEMASPTSPARTFWSEEAAIPAGGVLDMIRPEGVRGRTVYIDMDLRPYSMSSNLTLCEVEVYGTLEWFFRLDTKRGAWENILRIPTSSKTGCAQYCAWKDCKSFLWNPSNSDCVLYNDVPTITSPTDNLFGYVQV